MNCEVCGSTIYGPPKRIVLEGSRLLVCVKCSGLGEPDLKREERTLLTTQRPLGSPKPFKLGDGHLPREVEELEVADDFSRRIREAREKNKMTQLDLARAVKERLTIIRKIELGKMTPNMRLTRTLEHVLKVKLLQPRRESEIPAGKPEQSEPLLGDVIQYKKK